MKLPLILKIHYLNSSFNICLLMYVQTHTYSKLAISCYQMDRSKQEKTFADLKKYVPLFKEAGFSVAVWLWTFAIREEAPFVRITSPSGKVSAEECCPSDKEFCEFVCQTFFAVNNICFNKFSNLVHRKVSK